MSQGGQMQQIMQALQAQPGAYGQAAGRGLPAPGQPMQGVSAGGQPMPNPYAGAGQPQPYQPQANPYQSHAVPQWLLAALQGGGGANPFQAVAQQPMNTAFGPQAAAQYQAQAPSTPVQAPQPSAAVMQQLGMTQPQSVIDAQNAAAAAAAAAAAQPPAAAPTPDPRQFGEGGQ